MKKLISNELKFIKMKSKVNFYKFTTYKKILEEVNKNMDESYKQERFVSNFNFLDKKEYWYL